MFEKFTQKAIDVIQSAQNYATNEGHAKVLSSHILLGLLAQTKGVQAKILNLDKIDFEKVKALTQAQTKRIDNKDNIIFSLEARSILKSAIELTNELNSKLTFPQHIALAIFTNKDCFANQILREFDIDQEKITQNLRRMLDKSADIKPVHPEVEQDNTTLTNINDFFKENIISNILDNAQSKITASGYEIVGSEQIMQSILENKDYKVVELLKKYSIDSEIFARGVSQIPSRSAEFENSEKKIIFTPNAFTSLMLALDYAKESGSVEIQPEHVILGILKSKKGIAYNILSSLLPKGIDFEDVVNRQLNDNIPETLAILRLAKSQARELGSSTVGSEMILLGILSYGAGIASNTLRHLGITLKDAQAEVEKLIKPQAEVENLTYSLRAKKILEMAYSVAREHKRSKIRSENILYSMTKLPNCLAMQVLINLGTDILEIQQGIKQELLGGMDL